MNSPFTFLVTAATMNLQDVLTRVSDILESREDLSRRDQRQMEMRRDDVRCVRTHVGYDEMIRMGPGRFCGTVVKHLLFSRTPTFSIVTVFQRYVKFIVEIVLEEFNIPNTTSNQKMIYEDPSYTTIKAFARRVLGKN